MVEFIAAKFYPQKLCVYLYFVVFVGSPTTPLDGLKVCVCVCEGMCVCEGVCVCWGEGENSGVGTHRISFILL